MSINVVNSQGVKLFLAQPPSPPYATCQDAIAGIRAGTNIICPQDIGDIQESRGVTEYKCMSSNETSKSLGAVSREAFDLNLLLDPNNNVGQTMLRQAFLKGTPLVMGIEIPNEVMLYFPILISKQSTGIEIDAAVMSTFTVEISGDIMECPLSQAGSGNGRPIVNNGVHITNNGVPVVNTP